MHCSLFCRFTSSSFLPSFPLFSSLLFCKQSQSPYHLHLSKASPFYHYPPPHTLSLHPCYCPTSLSLLSFHPFIFTPCPIESGGSRGGVVGYRSAGRTATLPELWAHRPTGREGSLWLPPFQQIHLTCSLQWWWLPRQFHPALSSPHAHSPSNQSGRTWGSQTPPSAGCCWTSNICWLCRSRCRLEKAGQEILCSLHHFRGVNLLISWLCTSMCK